MKTVICEVCGEEMRAVYPQLSKRREKTSIYQCPACKLIWAPELYVNTEFVSYLDEEKRKEALEKTREDEFQSVITMLKKYIKPQARGLDVGCSYGWFMKKVKGLYNCEGIEAEPDIAEAAGRDAGKVYVGFFPEDMPDNQETYDFIIFNNVWEHINHTANLIQGCRKYLNKNGFLVITVPLSTGILYKISELLSKWGRIHELVRLWQLDFHSPHIYYFNKSNLIAIMKKYGFETADYKKLQNIDTSKMKERFEMDKHEKFAALKAALFRIGYPIIKIFPEDKGVFVFQYIGEKEK